MESKEKRCAKCNAQIRKTATRCKRCGAQQERLCFNCAHVILPKANYCTECKLYQSGLRKLISDVQTASVSAKALAGVVASCTAAIVFMYQCYGPSRTDVKFAHAEASALHVNIVNEGARRSYLSGAELTFGALPVEPRKLDVIERDGAVVKGGFPPRQDTAIGFRARGLRAKVKPGSGERYTRAEIEELLLTANYDVVLNVRLRESNGKIMDVQLPLKSADIDEFILEKIPGKKAVS
jgi:hypothetical protein